jgi:hypothetical protein
MAKVLMKGNEAIGEAAIRAGCLNYFAYPITPSPKWPNTWSVACRRWEGFFCRERAKWPWGT